uniref:tol-pal system protein YbgF n=1 Tax=Candidatus Electronema sp. TaxID=2698783 RepID=UPI004056F64C
MNRLNIAAAGGALLLLCQCASQDEVRRLNYQLRTVNQKMQTVESQTAEQLKKVESSASDRQLKEAAMSASRMEAVAEEARQLREVNQENIERFNQYKTETEDKIAALYAAIEQMQTENGHLSKSNEELVSSMQLKIEQLSSGLQQASQSKVHEAAQRAREAEQRAKEAAEKATEARKKAETALRTADGGKVLSPPAASGDAAAAELTTLHPDGRKMRRSGGTSAVVSSTENADPFEAYEENDEPPAPAAEDGLFTQGMDSFKKKDYKKAYKAFEQHLAGQPDSKQAANTLYLMGECLFNQGEYDLAILEYQKVISNYGGDPHCSAALLRQGMAFEKLTDKETAKIIYGKLIKEYPDSREAKVAQERQGNL